MAKCRSVISGIAVAVLLMSIGGSLVASAGPGFQDELDSQASLGTAFTYQGYLTESGVPANGVFDLAFALHADLEAGSQIGSTVFLTIPVQEGLFTAELDFGAVFDGTALWLEIGVRKSGDEGPYSTLTPRQRLTSTPFASYAAASSWAGLAGVPGGFDDDTDDDSLGSLGCNSGQIPEWNGSAWICGEDNVGTGTGGDITAVSAGYGLGGGTTSGDAILYVITDTIQARVSGACPTGWAIRAVHPDGSVDCELADTGTTYQAGTGLDLAGTTFAISPTYRLPQTCDSNQIARWNGTGWECAGDQTGGSAGWSLIGNAGTTAGTDFLGTTDDVPLQLHVNGVRALRLEPDSTSPNIIGGYGGNNVGASVHGATVSGGGRDLAINQVSADFGTVGGGSANSSSGYASTVGGGEGSSAGGAFATVAGGSSNAASANYATLSGGTSNDANAQYSVIGGGASNAVTATYGTIAGGLQNVVGGTGASVGGGVSNRSAGDYATVGGGRANSAAATYATIAGGGPSDPQNPTTTHNSVYDDYGVVGGGGGNAAGDNDASTSLQSYATVAGGHSNVASGQFATAGGGSGNSVSGYAATVGGGAGNTAGDNYASVLGGQSNSAGGQSATVAGGRSNSADASYAAVSGGRGNVVAAGLGAIPGGMQNYVGGSYGLAAGYQARAEHQGSFVWSDPTGPFTTTAENQFLIDASGGVGIGTNDPSRMLTVEGSALVQGGSAITVGVILSNARVLDAPSAIHATKGRIYVTSYSTNTLSIWNVTAPSSSTLISYTTSNLNGPMDLEVVGDRAYVASELNSRLVIMDLTDPARPDSLGSTDESLSGPIALQVSGKYAYVASSGDGTPADPGGLAVFDVSDPSQIRAGDFITTNLDHPSDVYVAGHYAYVTSEENDRLAVFDVSDPRPGQIAAAGAISTSLAGPVAVQVSGIYAYVVARDADSLVVFDVSDPEQIQYVGEVTTGLTRPQSLYVSGDRAYVAYAGDTDTALHCGLAVLDISDPAGIVLLNAIDMSDWLMWIRSGTVEEPVWTQERPKPVAVSGDGNRIYVANETHDSVTIFEINHLEAPALITGELQAARLEVTDVASVSGDLAVSGGLDVGPSGALIGGALSVAGPGGSHILGAMSVGGSGALISDTVFLTRTQWITAPTHALDVIGEGRFRVNAYNNLALRSPNAGGDEDAYIDFFRSDQTDVITPSARIEFDAADPLTHTSSIHFHTQGSGDGQMVSRLELTADGDLRPGADATYLLGTSTRRWDTVYSENGFLQTSDRRYKDNLGDLPYGLAEVSALRPVIFNWAERPDGGSHYGLIAQEVREVLPDIVEGDENEGALSMNYGELVPVLVKAVQEQQEQIEGQAERIAHLEERLTALEHTPPDTRAITGVLRSAPTLGAVGLLLGALWLVGMRRREVRS